MFNDTKAVLERQKPMRRTLRGLSAVVFAAVSLAGLASCTSMAASSGGTGDPVDHVSDGRQFASLRCATCHAMDRDQFSPNPNAPPMSRLLPRLEFKMLERASPQAFDMVHGSMPPLHLSLLDKEALMAYLESIAD